MTLSGLELTGFAEYTGTSESHIYALLNGTRELTNDVAEKLAENFNLNGSELLKSSFRITKKVIDKKKLEKFYKENKGVLAYFSSNIEERKVALFLENKLLNSDLFNSPVSVSEVRFACLEEGKELTSKRVSQILKYLVDKKKLKSKKKLIKLKSGKFGKRIIDYYYK